MYGSGVTICSFFTNIFGGSSASFSNPPVSGPQSCVSFSYTIHDSSDELRKGRNNHVMFCAIDDPAY